MKTNSEKVLLALDNNMGLYKSIFEANGITLNIDNEIYFSALNTPPLYSNLVPRIESWTPDNIFHEIDSNFKKENWPEWSIKDSFSCLDLSEHGFQKLFDAHWFYLSFYDRKPLSSENKVSFKKVTDSNSINEWISVWGEGQEVGKKIFNDQLLDDPYFSLVLGYQDGIPKYVAALNKTNDNIGISNFFVEQNTEGVWSDLLIYIYETFGNLDIVGYEDQETIKKISRLGATPTGDLRVWLKPRY